MAEARIAYVPAMGRAITVASTTDHGKLSPA
jgi:hypothetical protein